MQPGIIVGTIVGITLFVAVLLAVVTISCYIFCRSRKYEYNTGNEYRYMCWRVMLVLFSKHVTQCVFTNHAQPNDLTHYICIPIVSRVTVQHWKANSDHYTANRSETVSFSSSRGSSFMSSIGLKPKVRPRYGNSPADRVTVNPEFYYSTPLWCLTNIIMVLCSL